MALTVTPTDEMKTLKVGEKIYEIVDDEARTDLNTVKADLSQLPTFSDLYKAYPTDAASGPVASFSDGADGLPMQSVVAQIEPIQAGSGDPSPDNVRPISGWNAVKVNHAGKNVLDLSNVQLGTWNKWDIPNTLKPNTTYRYSVSNATYAYGLFMTSNHTETGGGVMVRLVTYIQNSSVTFTTPANVGDYPWLVLGGGNGNAGHADADFQLELGSTATDYEPYVGESVTIDLGQTVYGGTLDVVSGELTVLGIKDVLTVVNGVLRSSLFSESLAAQSVSVLGENVRLGLNRNSQTNNMQTASSEYNTKMANLCQHYFAYASDTAHWYINNQLYLFLPKTDVGETVETFKAFLQENPFEVYVPLATPITVSLTPHEIRSLLGANNVWADSGDSKVVYRADPTLFVQKKIAEAVAALS